MQNEPQEKKWSLSKIVAIIGDIASITGISLLYFSQTMDTNISGIFILKTLTIVTVSIGCLALIAASIQTLFRAVGDKMTLLWKVTVIALGLPIALIFCFFFIGSMVQGAFKMIDNAIEGKPLIEKNANNQ